MQRGSREHQPEHRTDNCMESINQFLALPDPPPPPLYFAIWSENGRIKVHNNDDNNNNSLFYQQAGKTGK